MRKQWIRMSSFCLLGHTSFIQISVKGMFTSVRRVMQTQWHQAILKKNYKENSGWLKAVSDTQVIPFISLVSIWWDFNPIIPVTEEGTHSPWKLSQSSDSPLVYAPQWWSHDYLSLFQHLFQCVHEPRFFSLYTKPILHIITCSRCVHRLLMRSVWDTSAFTEDSLA